MARNILILSSDNTGHGHKSITDSLIENFAEYPGIKFRVIDGFSLGGNLGIRIGKLYGTITRNAKDLWKFIWDISMKNPSLMRDFSKLSIQSSFLKVLRSIKPDIIVSVHPSFVGSVIDILEENKIDIPLIALVPDLISISPLWADKRALYTICPTQEAAERCIGFGVPESKIKVMGFPVREKFCRNINVDYEEYQYSPENPLKCLIMSGGEGSGNMGRVAEILLSNFNCSVKIVTGRNTILKRKLESSLAEKYPERVEIFGFTENIQELMSTSHLAVTRGSPNVMMEAVTCNVPLIITGALPGQEEENPVFLEKHQLGIVCTDYRALKNVVSELLEENGRKLNSIKKSQREYRNPDAARNIADFIAGIETVKNITIPDKLQKPGLTERTNEFFSNKTIVVRQKIDKAKKVIVKTRGE